jgi:DNA-binding MarR family transcriptional regulator
VRTFLHYAGGVIENDNKIAAWAALLRTHAAVLPRLEKALGRAGLPITWYDVLLVLNAAPQRRLRMTDLGHQATVSRERVSRVVGELEREGLVERQANPDDRRSAFAAVTPEGRKRLRAAAPVYLAAVEEHFLSYLSDREAKVIATALGRVLGTEELGPPA